MTYQFANPNEYTLDTLKSAPEKTFITFHYYSYSNVKTQNNIAPINVMIAPPRNYNQTTTAHEPVSLAFKVSPDNLPFLKESLGKARIMQYDIVNEIYYVDNGHCESQG